jgi:hypothetical protein
VIAARSRSIIQHKFLANEFLIREAPMLTNSRDIIRRLEAEG